MDLLSQIYFIVATFVFALGVWDRIVAAKKNRKDKLLKEMKEEISEEFKEIKETLQKIKADYISKSESKKYDNDLKKIICDFVEKFEDFEHKTDKRDAKFIAYTISQFADDLNNNAIRSEKGYQSILDFYDYYKNVLGKNSYVDEEIEFIKKKMGELK